MYYATYKGVGKSDIAVFETKQQRDRWVNFKDDFSKMFGATKENSTFERVALTSNKEIKNTVSNPTYKKVADSYNTNQWWYIRSI